MGRDTSSEPFDYPTLTSVRRVSERKFWSSERKFGIVAPLGFRHEGVLPFPRFAKGISNLGCGTSTASPDLFSQHNSNNARPQFGKLEFKFSETFSFAMINEAIFMAILVSSPIDWS
jgi:hypothetical protein